MASISYQTAIDAQIDLTQQLIDWVKNELMNTGEEELRQKPNTKKWNALECVEHLNLSNSLYLGNLEKAMQSPAKKRRDSYSPGFFGAMMRRNMLPKQDGTMPSQMKTFKNLEPRNFPTTASLASLHTFVDQQYRMLAWMEQAKDLDLDKNRVVSAIGPILKFKLGDCFQFLVAHNIRHLVQAQKAAGLAVGPSVLNTK